MDRTVNFVMEDKIIMEKEWLLLNSEGRD